MEENGRSKECMNQQMEDLRTMFTSFMSRQAHDREETQDECFGDEGSSDQHNHQDEKR